LFILSPVQELYDGIGYVVFFRTKQFPLFISEETFRYGFGIAFSKFTLFILAGAWVVGIFFGRVDFVSIGGVGENGKHQVVYHAGASIDMRLLFYK